jgi:hypothetical protein
VRSAAESGRVARAVRPGTPVFPVGVAGFEPTAPRSQSECATKLRHTPGADRLSVRAHGSAAGSLPRGTLTTDDAGVV